MEQGVQPRILQHFPCLLLQKPHLEIFRVKTLFLEHPATKVTCSAMTVSLLPAVARVNWSAFWTTSANSTRSNWFFFPTLSALTSWKPRGAASRGTRFTEFCKKEVQLKYVIRSSINFTLKFTKKNVAIFQHYVFL